MKEYGIKVNVVKTKVTRINISQKITVMTSEKKYKLNSSDIWEILTEDWRNKEEIKARITRAKKHLVENKTLFCTIQSWKGGNN